MPAKRPIKELAWLRRSEPEFVARLELAVLGQPGDNNPLAA